MFRNFFWFLRDPADEREQALYNRAYRRALLVLWCGIAVVLFVGGVTVEPATSTVIVTGTEILLLVSYLAGWSALRSEPLEYKTVKIQRRPPFWLLLVVQAVAMLALWLILIAQPGLYIVIAFLHVISSQFIFMVWSWEWTKPFPVHTRILGTIIFAMEIVGLLLAYPGKMWKRVALAVIVPLGFIVLSTLYVIFFLRSVVMPIYVATNAFEPELRENSTVLVDSTDVDLSVGDYVVIEAIDGSLVIGRVTEIEGGTVLLQFASSTESVPRDRVVGTVIPDFPWSAILQ
jgi:hypothetical protein